MTHSEYLRFVESNGIKSVDDRETLALILHRLGIDRRVYSLYGGCNDDATHLDRLANGEWTVYYGASLIRVGHA